jgi:chorismate mutase
MSFSLQSQKLLRLFSSQELSNTNLHLIAISNLQSHERRVIRHWCKKYGQPEKPLGEHTMEELLVEYLEDYYENNPKEIPKLLNSVMAIDTEWDGTVSAEYETSMQKRLSKTKKVDLSKWQSDEELTPEQEEEILANLGRNLRKSSKDEFEEDFQ